MGEYGSGHHPDDYDEYGENGRYGRYGTDWSDEIPFCFAGGRLHSGNSVGYTYWIPYVLPYAISGSFVLLVLVSYGLRNYCGVSWWKHLTPWLAFMFSVNGSLWIWIIYIFIWNYSCKHHGDWPRFFGYIGIGHSLSLAYFFFTAIFLISLIVITIYDAVTIKEGKFVGECLEADEATDYLETLKASAPRQRVLVEVYHEDVNRPRYVRIEGTQNRGNRHFQGNIDMGEAIRNKIVTFTEDRNFDYDTWQDPTDYPDINALLKENNFLKIRINPSVEPGDDITRQLLESFKRRLMVSCAYRDQMASDTLEGIIPASKFDKMLVKKEENVSFWFTWWGIRIACLLSISVFFRVQMKMKTRRISLNIKKKFFADPANVRRYDFEASIPGGQATVAVLSGDAGASSLLPNPNHKTSHNPSPSAPAPTNEKMDYFQDTERQPANWGEKPPPRYEDAIID